MKRSLLLINLLGLLLLFSHSSAGQQAKDMDPTELQVLSDIIQADTIPTVYFKTTISDLNQPLSRHLYYLKGFELCTSMENPDSLKLDMEERGYIVDRFSMMEVGNINKLIKEPKNFTLKKVQGYDWSVISLPVVFRDGKYAIYYSQQAYGGKFNLMKKIDGHWKTICYSYVWTE